MSWPEFLVMGGYAPYVWGAYGLTLTAMAGEVLLLIRRRKMLRETVASTTAAHAGRRACP